MVQAVRHEMTLRTVKSYKFHKQVFDSKVRIRCNDCVLHGGRGIQVGIPLAWDREVVGVVEEEGAILGAERDSNLQQNYALTKDLQSQYPVRRVGDVASCKLCLLTFDHERSKPLQHTRVVSTSISSSSDYTPSANVQYVTMSSKSTDNEQPLAQKQTNNIKTS